MLRLVPALLLTAVAVPAVAADPISLFDDKTFAGWEGDTAKTWRIEDGAITAGSLDVTVPRNDIR